MVSSLRARLLSAKDIKSESVTVAEWDGITLEIRGLTGAQQSECSTLATVKEKGPDDEMVERVDNGVLSQQMLLRSLYDPETRGLVLEAADADALWQKSADVLNRLARIAMRLNGMTKADDKAMEKNSVATASGDPVSA